MTPTGTRPLCRVTSEGSLRRLCRECHGFGCLGGAADDGKTHQAPAKRRQKAVGPCSASESLRCSSLVAVNVTLYGEPRRSHSCVRSVRCSHRQWQVEANRRSCAHVMVLRLNLGTRPPSTSSSPLDPATDHSRTLLRPDSLTPIDIHGFATNPPPEPAPRRRACIEAAASGAGRRAAEVRPHPFQPPRMA